MKKIIGFSDNDIKEENITVLPAEAQEEKPVRSIVKVFFPSKNRAYSYYNDKFDLKCDDAVFVSGKLFGVRGFVTNVNYHFRINTADYKKVIARPETAIKGSFFNVNGKMVSFDTNMTPDKFGASIISPPDPDEEPKDGEIIYGEGWSVELADFEEYDYVDADALDDAIDLCKGGKVTYIALQDGEGRAYIEEDNGWRTVDFEFDGTTVSGIYCDCLYPEPCICAHQAAMLITLRMILNSERLKGRSSFAAIDKNYLLINAINSSDQIFLD